MSRPLWVRPDYLEGVTFNQLKRALYNTNTVYLYRYRCRMSLQDVRELKARMLELYLVQTSLECTAQLGLDMDRAKIYDYPLLCVKTDSLPVESKELVQGWLLINQPPSAELIKELENDARKNKSPRARCK